VLTVFNKTELYEANTFDEWLDDETRNELMRQLEERWQNETGRHAVFISAIEKRNIDKLRQAILQNVRELYGKRYPYRTEYFF
jgi:GTP-binding protein HflX